MARKDTGARAEILATLRRSLGRRSLGNNSPGNNSLGHAALPAAERQALEARLGQPRANLIPARARPGDGDLVRLFTEMAVFAGASVQPVSGAAAVPAAVAQFLDREGLPGALRLAPDPALTALAWAAQPGLTATPGRAEDGDPVSVTPAFAGIAETGTCMLLSGRDCPTTLALLVEAHIVMLMVRDILGSQEEAWARLRRASGGASDGEAGGANGAAGGASGFGLPRAVSLITGPSRSADIEQKLQIGAHGPRRLHILLVAADGDAPRDSGAPGNA